MFRASGPPPDGFQPPLMVGVWALAIVNLITVISGVTQAVLVNFSSAQEGAEESLQKGEGNAIR